MTGTGVCAPMICWRLTRLATAVRCDDRAGGNRGTLRRLSGPFQQVDRLPLLSLRGAGEGSAALDSR